MSGSKEEVIARYTKKFEDLLKQFSIDWDNSSAAVSVSSTGDSVAPEQTHIRAPHSPEHLLCVPATERTDPVTQRNQKQEELIEGTTHHNRNDDTQYLAESIQEFTPDLVDTAYVDEEQLIDFLIQHCISEEESLPIRKSKDRKTQVRLLIVLLKHRSFNVLSTFLARIERQNKPLVDKIWHTFKIKKEAGKIFHCCVFCRLKEIDVRLVIDHVFSKQIISDSMYRQVVVCEEQPGEQQQCWNMIFRSCARCKNPDVAVETMTAALRARGHYDHLADALIRQFQGKACERRCIWKSAYESRQHKRCARPSQWIDSSEDSSHASSDHSPRSVSESDTSDLRAATSEDTPFTTEDVGVSEAERTDKVLLAQGSDEALLAKNGEVVESKTKAVENNFSNSDSELTESWIQVPEDAIDNKSDVASETNFTPQEHSGHDEGLQGQDLENEKVTRKETSVKSPFGEEEAEKETADGASEEVEKNSPDTNEFNNVSQPTNVNT